MFNLLYLLYVDYGVFCFESAKYVYNTFKPFGLIVHVETDNNQSKLEVLSSSKFFNDDNIIFQRT